MSRDPRGAAPPPSAGGAGYDNRTAAKVLKDIQNRLIQLHDTSVRLGFQRLIKTGKSLNSMRFGS